jgi:Zn ribbon nucleic-acid-binding protein
MNRWECPSCHRAMYSSWNFRHDKLVMCIYCGVHYANPYWEGRETKVTVSQAVQQGQNMGMTIFQAEIVSHPDDLKHLWYVNGEQMTGQELVDLITMKANTGGSNE